MARFLLDLVAEWVLVAAVVVEEMVLTAVTLAVMKSVIVTSTCDSKLDM